jgi:hypothetical protein
LLRDHQFPAGVPVDPALLEWELNEALALCRGSGSDHEDTRDLLSVILATLGHAWFEAMRKAVDDATTPDMIQ